MKSKLANASRFKALKHKLAKQGAYNPGALAAFIGRKKRFEKSFRHKE